MTSTWAQKEKLIVNFLAFPSVTFGRLEVPVVHRGKTQLNFFSETQQYFREHNNLFENTRVFSRTQQYFREHNNILQNTKIFLEHNEISLYSTIFSKTN